VANELHVRVGDPFGYLDRAKGTGSGRVTEADCNVPAGAGEDLGDQPERTVGLAADLAPFLCAMERTQIAPLDVEHVLGIALRCRNLRLGEHSEKIGTPLQVLEERDERALLMVEVVGRVVRALAENLEQPHAFGRKKLVQELLVRVEIGVERTRRDPARLRDARHRRLGVAIRATT